ncbi:ABC transporter ATP-binding protein [Sulfuriroseicoccus oceanibius]|uniref:ABC transporter ATP-binding protein n=1 Tax=Sulfuriroseicoccus oceanibius TaxID=2707525 RepID=A0A6B3L7X7_9BACT|nr:ABC transporter ATP-binding protein [Sulfuriroseicoccus oceanibius]QQL45292.1 ABC transporter ATP-binding protein [Sulfuriroseicoccus oceanibius]
MSSVVRVFAYLKRYPTLASGQLLCAVLMTLALIIFPEVTGHVTRDIIPNKKFDEFIPWVLLALSGFFLRELLNGLRIILNNVFEQKVIYDVRSDLYKKIQRLPLNWFDSRRTGDIMTRVIEDVTAMERVLIDGVEQGLVAVLQILIIGTMLYLNDATVAMWATIPVPLLALSAWLYTRNARHRYKAQREATSDMNALLHDNLSGVRQIKAYTSEEAEHKRFNEFSNRLRKATLKVMRYWAMYSPGTSFIAMTGYVLVLAFGGWRVMQGQMEHDQFLKFFLYISLFYEPVGRLHQLNQMALSARAAADRVFEILDTEDEPNATTGDHLPRPVKAHVRFEDVSFSYGDTPTLSHIDLDAQPGETIALVGPTGAGKSTIVSLLTRFYECSAGRITVDGKDISGLAKSDLRSHIGYVTQEPFLFNGTVRENLVLADRTASDEEIWAALDASNAGHFVRKLPEGLDTNVGERGVKLSGGEKQRLSIARALLKDPPILLLDEATSAVDNETERLIQQALDRLLEQRTSFVIAHRLSTVRNATRIYVLDGGSVVETGTHDELMAFNGLYAELASRDFAEEE